MKQEDFDKILENRILKTRQMLASKGKEYSTDSDKLHNFKRAADMNRSHPCQAAHGMLTKHLISYMDMVEGLANGAIYPRSVIDEKFGDIINYFILQEAIFIEHGC